MNSYQKIMQHSNYYYNEGLERAKVHSISSAIESLEKSLHYNKNNVEARNLLGLCYYEIGESVAALREWVISENIKQENNLATKYIKDIQPDMARTGKLNQCVKKYNQALAYCHSDSEDLAVIQLKKVISMNPKFLRAHLLLALLYIHMEQYSHAKDVLRRAARIDSNNTMLLRYTKEVNEQLANSDSRKNKKKNISDDSVAYVSGNDTIIRPAYFRDNTTISTIVNIIFGLVVGFLISFFLVVPGVKRQASSDSAAKLREANNTISTKNVTIKTYQAQIEELTDELQEARNNSSESESTVAFYKELLEAYVAYGNRDYVTAGEALAKIDEKAITKDFKKTYKLLKEQVNARYLAELYKEGSNAYNQGSYDKATEAFEKIMKIDEDFKDGNTLYYCAQAYRKLGENQKAIVLYQKVVERYPDTYRASSAQAFINQLSNN